MAMRHRQEKTRSILASPSDGYVQQLSPKKNQSDATQAYWKLKPHVALDWDAREQKVVSKRDQVAISWGHLIPHSSWGNHNRHALADVLQVPPELFQLEELKDVLTLEIWNECLSSPDRQFLRELLPKEVDQEGLVHSLLRGDNFHFGNPLATWGDAFGKGDLHPDSIQQRECEFKRTQKEYHVEVQKYHHKMLETVGTLKELWASCKSTEKELCVKLKRWTKRKSSKNGAASAAVYPLVPQEFKAACVPEEKWGNCCIAENRNANKDMVTRCKRRKIGSQQQALERTDSLPAEESKKINSMMYNAVNVDGCTEIMHTLKVSQKQYADIMYLKERGEDLLLDSLSSILDDSQKIGVHRINGCDKNDTSKIRTFWSSLVENEMPAAYAVFLKRRVHKKTQAKFAAEQCMKQHPQFLCKCVQEDTLICKSSSNVSALILSSEQKLPNKNRIEHEASLGAEAGKQKQLSASESSVTCIEGHVGMQTTVDSCMSSVDVMYPQIQQLLPKNKTDGWNKLGDDPVILTSVHEENNGRLGWNVGEDEGLPTPGRQHFQVSNVQKDNIVASESDISEDEEVSAIKNIWSSSDLDTQELHSQNDGMPAVSRNGSNMWDSHSKPASEVNVASGSAESDEVDQRISFQAANFCTGLDTHLLDLHTMPFFDNHDQLHHFSRHTSFLRHQEEPVSNGTLFYSNHATESSTDNHRLQHHDHSLNKHNKLDAGYHSLMSVKSNKLPEMNDFHLQRDEIHSALFPLGQDKIEHRQKQQMLLPKFRDQKACSDGFLSSDTSSSQARLASPVAFQSSRRKGSLGGASQPRPHLSLASQSVHECAQQNHEPITELRLLVDDRTEKHLGHQRTESVSLRTQSDPGEHQMMRDNIEQVQAFPFHQQLHQNQNFQHSRQDLYPPCTISSMLSGWPDSQQMLADRTASTNPHYGPTGQWNVGEDTLQANWAHMKVVPGPFSFRGKTEDRRAVNALSHWDRLSQNSYIVDNGPSKHGQFVGMPRTFSCGSYTSTEDGQGIQVHEDWAPVQPFSVNQHPYTSPSDKYRSTASHPWMNVSPGSHIPQQAQYEQQALQDHCLSKPNSRVGSSWVRFRL